MKLHRSLDLKNCYNGGPRTAKQERKIGNEKREKKDWANQSPEGSLAFSMEEYNIGKMCLYKLTSDCKDFALMVWGEKPMQSRDPASSLGCWYIPRKSCKPCSQYFCLRKPIQRSLEGYSQRGHKESAMTEWLHFTSTRTLCTVLTQPIPLIQFVLIGIQIRQTAVSKGPNIEWQQVKSRVCKVTWHSPQCLGPGSLYCVALPFLKMLPLSFTPLKMAPYHTSPHSSQ